MNHPVTILTRSALAAAVIAFAATLAAPAHAAPAKAKPAATAKAKDKAKAAARKTEKTKAAGTKKKAEKTKTARKDTKKAAKKTARKNSAPASRFFFSSLVINWPSSPPTAPERSVLNIIYNNPLFGNCFFLSAFLENHLPIPFCLWYIDFVSLLIDTTNRF